MGEISHEPVVIVTGASGAMGREIARELAQLKMSVICADIQSPGEVASYLTDANLNAVAVTLDVTDSRSWESAVASALLEYGRIDALVNVAGTAVMDGSDSVFNVDVGEWRRILDVNLIGVALGTEAVVPGMRERGAGRIVNIASVAGLRGNGGVAAYSASKGAVIALTRQSAVDLAPFNITVNCVAPGIMEKAMFGRDSDTEQRKLWLARPPIGRAVRETEIAAAVGYFLTSASAIVTGQVLAVDGGWSSSL